MNVTDGDRDKAIDIMSLATNSQADMFGEVTDAIAAALAEERERARAPFLRLADELEQTSDMWNDHAGTVPTTYDGDMGRASAYRRSAQRIRKAAEETTE